MSKSKNSKKYKGQNLVFIVACPRSGTTWLQRMLAASSPLIKTGPESFLFTNYIKPQYQAWDDALHKNLPDLHQFLTKDEFLDKLRGYTLELLYPITSTLNKNELFIEKTSSHALSLDLIRELLPKSKVINIIRDPRDVIASWLAASRTWAKEDKPKRASELAYFWKDSILSTEKAKKVMNPGNFFELTYEDLSQKPLLMLENVLNFLNISENRNYLKQVIKDHHIEKMKMGKGYHRVIIKGEIGGKKGKVWKEPEGYFRKGKIGSWKQDLTPWETFQVWRITRGLMKKLKYYW